jgi:hypothetical protein
MIDVSDDLSLHQPFKVTGHTVLAHADQISDECPRTGA